MACGALKRRQYQPDFLYRAVTSGDVDVVSAFSSDGRIARYGLVSSGRSQRRACRLMTRSCWSGRRMPMTTKFLDGAEAADRRASTLTLMQQANLMVDRDQDKQTPAATAALAGPAIAH